jgi:hypothetical protein
MRKLKKVGSSRCDDRTARRAIPTRARAAAAAPNDVLFGDDVRASIRQNLQILQQP